ncbi:MAG: hypothetical protein LAQ30_05980 [Acidobacteriia bacterium]|nr:hypothetical protein [Terriglobia bacterium]
MQSCREPRFACYEDVVVAFPDGSETPRPARVTNTSPMGVTLEMNGPAPLGTRLRIEFPGTVAVGEAISCRPAPGAYYIGVRLEQALGALAELVPALDDFAGWR